MGENVRNSRLIFLKYKWLSFCKQMYQYLKKQYAPLTREQLNFYSRHQVLYDTKGPVKFFWCPLNFFAKDSKLQQLYLC